MDTNLKSLNLSTEDFMVDLQEMAFAVIANEIPVVAFDVFTPTLIITMTSKRTSKKQQYEQKMKEARREYLSRLQELKTFSQSYVPSDDRNHEEAIEKIDKLRQAKRHMNYYQDLYLQQSTEHHVYKEDWVSWPDVSQSIKILIYYYKVITLIRLTNFFTDPSRDSKNHLYFSEKISIADEVLKREKNHNYSLFYKAVDETLKREINSFVNYKFEPGHNWTATRSNNVLFPMDLNEQQIDDLKCIRMACVNFTLQLIRIFERWILIASGLTSKLHGMFMSKPSLITPSWRSLHPSRIARSFATNQQIIQLRNIANPAIWHRYDFSDCAHDLKHNVAQCKRQKCAANKLNVCPQHHQQSSVVKSISKQNESTKKPNYRDGIVIGERFLCVLLKALLEKKLQEDFKDAVHHEMYLQLLVSHNSKMLFGAITNDELFADSYSGLNVPEVLQYIHTETGEATPAFI
jgi:hypothetical protein